MPKSEATGPGQRFQATITLLTLLQGYHDAVHEVITISLEFKGDDACVK
jgi:hypothetical protein